MSRTARLLAFVAVALAACGSQSNAAPGGCTNDQWLVPFAFESITVSSTAIGFTTTTWAPTGQQPAAMAVVTSETDAVRYRADGLNPTAAVGQLMASSGTLTACGAQSLKQVRFIRVTNDATLMVAYYRQGNQ